MSSTGSPTSPLPRPAQWSMLGLIIMEQMGSRSWTCSPGMASVNSVPPYFVIFSAPRICLRQSRHSLRNLKVSGTSTKPTWVLMQLFIIRDLAAMTGLLDHYRSVTVCRIITRVPEFFRNLPQCHSLSGSYQSFTVCQTVTSGSDCYQRVRLLPKFHSFSKVTRASKFVRQ